MVGPLELRKKMHETAEASGCIKRGRGRGDTVGVGENRKKTRGRGRAIRAPETEIIEALLVQAAEGSV